MPELPDIQIYLDALERRIPGGTLDGIRIGSPFLLRSVSPPIDEFEGRVITGLGRLGKRIVFELEDEHYLVLHLMVAGRLAWKPRGAAVPGRNGLAAFDFANGTLILTEAGSKRRASLHTVRGKDELREHDRGGMDILTGGRDEFAARLCARNHTLKRALCDPANFSGIGNAYSDEILHAAALSPFRRTGSLDPEEVRRLFTAARETLQSWIDRLRQQTGTGFPTRVRAFRPEMAVHGKYREPCPVCASPVQRIVYADNETNYCARCQTGGKLLKDRALSRLLKSDWPRSIDEMDALKGQGAP